MDTITVATEGVTVDLLIWRRHRQPMPGLLEATLDANPGLAGLGPVLPVGAVVNIPSPATSAQAQTVVGLFD